LDNAFAEFAFWVLAAISVAGALGVVRTQNMFRAALLLVVSFLGVAGIFALVHAEFLAVIQVLVYAGGVSVLVIFAVMITRDVAEGNRSTPVGPSGLIAAATLFIGLVVVVLDSDWLLLGDIEAGSTVEAVLVDTPAQLGRVLLGDFVLAFEVAGVVLLAAVVGALALVRER
jgi:NADH:ubiquinone oxidoreductase subunit 6 (subunit J)